MLRHLHLAVLYLLCLSLVSALHFPNLFLRPRQQNSTIATPVINAPTTSTTSVSDAATTTGRASTTGTDGPTISSVTTTRIASSPATQATVTSGGLQTPSATTVTSTSVSTIPPTSSSPSSVSSTRPQTTSSLISSSSVVSVSSTTQAPDTSSAAPSTTDAPSTASEYYTTIVVTENGKTSTSVSKTTSTPTAKATLQDGASSGQSTVSDMAKKVIAGIVGGIGGALLLAGIAFALYRVYGKKKARRDQEEDDFFSAGLGSETSLEKKNSTRTGVSGWGPSRITDEHSEPLDRYKAGLSPSIGYKSPMSVNTASNF